MDDYRSTFGTLVKARTGNKSSGCERIVGVIVIISNHIISI